MKQTNQHEFVADSSFDGGDLDCGNGLLLLIRKHIDPLASGQLLEIISTEISVEEDLPAWCRLTKNELVSWTKRDATRSFLVCKGTFVPDNGVRRDDATIPFITKTNAQLPLPVSLPSVVATTSSELVRFEISTLPIVADISPCAVMGIGSWPRPASFLRTLHEHLNGRLQDPQFEREADDAVKLAVEAQLRAGVDVISDGEQRRDNYSSFVGGILDNCQLVPLTDLLPLVEDPDKFAAEMEALDVPFESVRHPVVFGKIRRSRPLALHEVRFLKTLSDRPIKVALPGPYLLSRTMWLECLADKAYDSRESLASDIVAVLRQELFELLSAGVTLVQFDEPVLTEVVFGGQKQTRSFMCGALSERGDVDQELQFAIKLLNEVVADVPAERVGMHICRGNWTPDESVALDGDYWPLLPVLTSLNVGTVFLEFCTPRSGDLAVIKELPADMRIGIGVVNPKDPLVESVDSILEKMSMATNLVDRSRLLFTPDCGFATFADNPVASAKIAEAKMRALVTAASVLRGK